MVRLFAERVSEQQPIVLLRPDAERLKSLNESFYRLLNCLRENPAHGNLMALSMLLEILCAIHACREYAAPLQSASFYPTPLMAALDYINGHFQESITNATISGVAAVSPSYLNRLFRKYLHCTPHAYLLSRRMAYARNCLVRGASVTETCYMAGFQDSASFAAIFKRITGLTPSRFRQNNFERDRN